MATPADPCAEVRQLVYEFLRRCRLGPDLVSVNVTRENDGDEVILLKPRATGAGEVLIRTAPTTEGRYFVSIFIGDSEDPLEIAGPLNTNKGQPYRLATEEVSDILYAVAVGEGYVELDDVGKTTRVVVPNLFDPSPRMRGRRIGARVPLAAWKTGCTRG